MDGLILLAFAALIYFLPAIIAANREHHQTGPIVILNLFLGWTLLGWVVALAWSVSSVAKPASAAKG